LRHEAERLITTPLTAEELQAAKNKLLGQYALGKQTNAQLAQLLGWYEVLGLGIDFDAAFQEAVAGVTAAAAQGAAASCFLSPAVALLGPEAAIAPLDASPAP
jgi:zinc protease